LHKRGPG